MEAEEEKIEVRPIASDAELIEVVKIMMHDEVLSDSFTPKERIARNAFRELVKPGVVILGFFCDSKLFGYAWAEQRYSVTWEISVAVLPEYRGRKALDAAKMAIGLAPSFGAKKLIGFVAEPNRAAYLFDRMLGFELEGKIVNGFELDGELYDINVVGYSLGGK